MKKVLLPTLLVLGCLFVSCEQNLDENPIRQKNDVESINPYDYVGESHNEMLDSFMDYLDGEKSFSTYDLYAYNAQNNLLESNETKETFVNNLQSIDDISYNLLFNNSFDLSSVIDNEQIVIYLNKFKDIMQECIINSKEGINPSAFSSEIKVLEDEVISSLNSTQDTSKMKDYVRVLCMLSIAKHSYSYWYEAIFDKVGNSWSYFIHNRFENMTLTKEKSDEPSFWERCLDFCNAVVSGLAATTVDVVGFGVACVSNLHIGIIDGPTGPILDFAFPIVDVVTDAADASVNAWNNVRD